MEWRLPSWRSLSSALLRFRGGLVGAEVLDGIDLSSTSSTVRVLAEATLALVLFSDASISGNFAARSVCRCACSASDCR